MFRNQGQTSAIPIDIIVKHYDLFDDILVCKTVDKISKE
jgi:hypothetical protein